MRCSCPRTCRCGSRRRSSGSRPQEYRNELADVDTWTGIVELDVDADIDRPDLLRPRGGPPVRPGGRAASINSGLVLRAPGASALARVRADGRAHLIDGDRHLFDVRGRSAEQRVAMDLLVDDTVGIVSMGGPAGTGKSVLALAAGLESVLERGDHRKVIVFRPLYAVGGQDLGYLPGTESEKMNPWSAAVSDALEAMAGPGVIRRSSSGTCSRCSRSPTSAAAPSPTASSSSTRRRTSNAWSCSRR